MEEVNTITTAYSNSCYHMYKYKIILHVMRVGFIFRYQVISVNMINEKQIQHYPELKT